MLYGAVADSKRHDRPHWTTFIAPVSSVLVASLSLFTTWYVFRQSGEVARAIQRPFISVEYTQITPAQPTAQDGQVTGLATFLANLRLKNVGKSPAYNIEFAFIDKQYQCTRRSPFTLAQDHSKVVRISCMTLPGYLADLTKLEVHPLAGKVTYTDGYGKHYDEPSSLPLRIGTPLNSPFFELNTEQP